MKLIGRDIRFTITASNGMKAGATFIDVTFNEEASVIDTSTALGLGSQRVDENDARASIQATGLLDDEPHRTSSNSGGGASSSSAAASSTKNGSLSTASFWNFIDLAQIGRVVDIKLTAGGDSTVPDTKLFRYKPWQISKASFKHGKRAVSQDTIELIGTSKGVPDNYVPGQLSPAW